MKETHTKILGVRISPPVRKALEAMAKAEHRTLSNLVQKILAEHVADREKSDRPKRS
jgi:predicted HicB family RNase H-like nuclease